MRAFSRRQLGAQLVGALLLVARVGVLLVRLTCVKHEPQIVRGGSGLARGQTRLGAAQEVVVHTAHVHGVPLRRHAGGQAIRSASRPASRQAKQAEGYEGYGHHA